MPDDRLAISVTHADGRVTRWAYNEVDGKNIPNDLTFSTSIPGGFKDASCSLLRRLDQDHPDQDLFDDVHIYGAGGRTAWDGRMTQFPRSHGDSFRITPGAVGWAAHLRDNPSFKECYVSRAPAWGEAILDRKIFLATATVSQGDISWQPEGGALVCSLPNQALGGQIVAESWADFGAGIGIGTIMYQGASTSPPAGYLVQLRASNAPGVATDNYALTFDDTLRTQALSVSARRHIAPALYSAGSAVTPASGANYRLSKFAAYGGTGLTTRAISGEPDGLFASDVIADIVARSAPQLSFAGIQATTFAIPHLVYLDPVTAEFAISDVNKYHLYDWGVYDNRGFFYLQPDPDRLCWEARLGDGAHMDADGLTGEQVINGVFVTYPDPTGAQKTVGPTGGNFDTTDAALADTSDANPVNSHGIPAKWDQLTLSFPTTEAGAVQIGAVYLAERSLATRRGSLTLTGLVQHPTEGKVPVWRVRAGDWIRVTDLNGENASVQRKIIETSYTHATRSITLSLDNTVAKLDAILARVGVQTGIMTGGGF